MFCIWPVFLKFFSNNFCFDSEHEIETILLKTNVSVELLLHLFQIKSHNSTFICRYTYTHTYVHVSECENIWITCSVLNLKVMSFVRIYVCYTHIHLCCYLYVSVAKFIWPVRYLFAHFMILQPHDFGFYFYFYTVKFVLQVVVIFAFCLFYCRFCWASPTSKSSGHGS